MLLPSADIRAPAWSPAGRFRGSIRFGADERPDVVCVWDTQIGQELAFLELKEDIDSLTFSSEQELVIACEQGCLLWDVQTSTTRPIRKRGDRAWAIAISPDRQTL